MKGIDMFSRKLPGAVAAALVALGVGASAAHAQGPPIKVTNPGNAGPGTLRSAINQANAQAALSVIEFALPATGTVITPQFDLPALTAPVVVDGLSQPGAAPGQPVVVIDAINTTRALELITNASVVHGLVINESSGVAAADGIQITGNGNKIAGTFVGTDSAGAQLGFGNLTTGVSITGDANIVSDSVIAESDGDGLVITGDDNVVQGNRLGLPYGGGLGNSGDGLSITGDRNAVHSRNVISENNGNGASIAGNFNRVEDNYVGVDETGADGPGNVGDGVAITGNQNQLVGNVLARNDTGALIDGTSNTIVFNAIGTDAGMTVDLGNRDGVQIHGNSNLVGGTGDEARNVISGNDFSGVAIEAGANNRVHGNRIGTDGDGLLALPNDDGVLVNSSFNVIEDNLLAGNNDAGVRFDADGFGPPINNVVEANVIGLDASGSAALPNDEGIAIEDAHRNALVDNVISGNVRDGVRIAPVDLAGADGNWLTGNAIEDNGQSGVEIDGGDDNLVGQPGAARNTIAGNGEDGVTIATGQDNAIANNSIHDNDDLGIDLAADGASVNDGLLDLDAGPNGLQNHPKITDRVLVFELSDDPIPFLIPKSRVSWTLRSAASSHYRLEFYVSDGCDASGRGEAPDLVATRDVTTDANGLTESSLDLDPLAAGETVAATATVTDPNGVFLGASSELSPCG